MQVFTSNIKPRLNKISGNASFSVWTRVIANKTQENNRVKCKYKDRRKFNVVWFYTKG